MNEKTANYISGIINALEANIKTIIHQGQIFWLELNLAASSIFVYLTLLCFAVLLCISTWVCINLVLITTIFSIGFTLVHGILATLILNVTGLIVVYLSLKNTAKNFKFSASKAYLKGEHRDSITKI